MSLGVSSGDLIGSWSLSFSDIAFVTGKAETARLGLAVQLRFFAGHGFFVPDHASIPSDGVLSLAEQLGLDAKSVNHSDFSGRTARRHCSHILRSEERRVGEEGVGPFGSRGSADHYKKTTTKI